ncbi:MAG: ribonuclease E/G [Pelagibacterales bacterium]|nr:ribonuclease E/G [Pelagibacterales bacterium]
MKKSILVDAAHSEETRVLVLSENIIEELDFESTTKAQHKGNIYLAKVSRVEPSLRAAFVDYGNDRHGFLPFSEIHPDYFQIPVSDKERLIESTLNKSNMKQEIGIDLNTKKKLKSSKSENDEEEISFNEQLNLKQASIRRSKLYSKYKIQEVIKRRQILLIQVTKEERGNKGAALTTFLSLAGRYCVLMPNSANSGGISKKIPFKTRKKMRDIINAINIPVEMSMILRTAGSLKTKTEIKRDYDNLIKLWNEIKNKTMKSIAPILVHQENHIIKRVIRDYFSNELSEIVIEGDEAFKLGKSFMKTLMPSKVKLIKKFKESLPIFNFYDVEKQINHIFQPEVQLKSGGSIVISPTEALVSIDVNSGRSTTERDIEPTAVKTNLEAAKEIARQLKLRDLGGLIVIDFIDMNIRKNNYLVENVLKNSVKFDRAKIQIGRISSFGLLEMSRQRMKPSLLELNFKVCNVCEGTGLVRSIESQSLQLIRNLDLILKSPQRKEIKLELNSELSEYLLNNKYHFFANSNSFDNHLLTIKVGKNINENKFSITVNNLEEEKTEEKKVEANLFHEKKEKTNKRSYTKKKITKNKDNGDKEKTLKRKTKEDSNKIKQTERNKSSSKSKKQEYQKTNSVKAKVKKKPSQKPKKEKSNATNSSLEVKKGWWKK